MSNVFFIFKVNMSVTVEMCIIVSDLFSSISFYKVDNFTELNSCLMFDAIWKNLLDVTN